MAHAMRTALLAVANMGMGWQAYVHRRKLLKAHGQTLGQVCLLWLPVVNGQCVTLDLCHVTRRQVTGIGTQGGHT
jgi:hypothetical protein